MVDDNTWLVFVKFQWTLRKSLLQAGNFLSAARQNRSYVPPLLAPECHFPPVSGISKRKRRSVSRNDVASKVVRYSRKHTRPRKKRTRAKANTKGLSTPLNPMIVDHPKFSGECSPEIISNDDCRMEEFGDTYVLINTSPKEQSMDPIIINSPSCPSSLEQSSAFTGGIESLSQLGETAFNHQSEPINRQDMVPVNIPISVSNTGSPIDSFTYVVSNTTVPVFHTTSDGKPGCNIGVDTFAAACLDSSMIKHEREYGLGPPVLLNTSLTCLEQSFPMVNHFEQCPSTLKMEDWAPFNWLYDDLPNGPMVLYHDEEETEIHFPAHCDESQQFTVIDKRKEPLHCYPPMWAQVGPMFLQESSLTPPIVSPGNLRVFWLV